MKAKNPIAQALRRMAKNENMGRERHKAQKAANTRWNKWRAKQGLPLKEI